MIVKNEKDVITRCLQSVLPIIDTWVIVDTGSTDGTQKIIKDYMKNIPGELHERPWVNFGHNRQEALLLAKDKADYILFMDADDLLAFADDFKMPELTQDFYAIAGRCKEGEEYWFHRLINSKVNWRWEGAIHEDLLCDDSAQGCHLLGVTYVYLHDGCRSKDPDKWKKDAAILLDSIEKDPKNPRNYFYLARSYQNGDDLEHALEYYKKRGDMPEGHPEEIFLSKISVAKLQHVLKYDPQVVINSFLDAYICRPHRKEPLYYIALLYRNYGKYQKGYEIASFAVQLPENPNEFLSVEKPIYDYALDYELALCAGQSGHYSEGIKSCEKLLAKDNIPEDDAKKIRELYNVLLLKNVDSIKENVLTYLKEHP